jgi:hypothetical protein
MWASSSKTAGWCSSLYWSLSSQHDANKYSWQWRHLWYSMPEASCLLTPSSWQICACLNAAPGDKTNFLTALLYSLNISKTSNLPDL